MDVSIIIPYNEDRGYLDEAIRSAVMQDYPRNRYEIIVQEGDHFLGKNINDALRRAKGRYIKVLAEDDLLTPNCIGDLLSGMNCHRCV